MTKYCQLVLGSAGTGKSTYCRVVQEHCAASGRTARVGNLDPAADAFGYQVAFDVRELISVSDVMQELDLGPNGGLLFAMEHLVDNLDWLGAELDDFVDDEALIYFKKIQDFLKKGYQVLVLLPEIALTNQIKERFKEYFGNYPALWHSDISEKNKRLIWHGIANHKINLVLGARSSLFLPFKKLGLIIIDEEHDQSYKQEDQVIYNARDMAVLMASIKKISVILVSATPSIETYYNTVNKKFSYISLDKRYGDAELPEVKFVDLKKNPPLKSKFISWSIIPELKNILDKGN
jgi:primosomal protein N'